MVKKPRRRDHKRPDSTGSEQGCRPASTLSRDQLEQRVQELAEALETRSRELEEALEYQTATSEVLNVISRSTTDLEPVLESIATTAMRLCLADYVHIYKLAPDGNYYLATARGIDEDYSRSLFGKPFRPDRGSLAARAALERRPVHIPNIPEDPDYTLRIGKQRTGLGVPLMRSGSPIGVIVLIRTEVRPFSDKHIEMVSTFADQAVIAMENTRLFNELQVSLEYQTATSEVLNAISRSPSDAQPVFDTIVQSAVSICGSLFANVFRYDGEMLHFVASHNVGRSYVELLADTYPMRPDRTQVSGRVVLSGSVVHLQDALADPEYDKQFPAALGWRRMLGVPMLGTRGLLGVIVVGWAEAGPVPKNQEDQLKSFADQAVIAIENARLFNELQESLEYQTAASDLLGVISRSPSDVKPVFDAIVDHAVQLCEAEFSHVSRYHDGMLHMEAVSNMRPEETEVFRSIFPRPPDRTFVVGRAFLDGVPVQVEDVGADPDFNPSILDVLKTTSAHRTYLGIPILRHGEAIGVIGLGRREAKPFTERQVALVQTFAEQAAIAIENARTFAEIQEKSKQVQQQAAELSDLNRTLESRVAEQVEEIGRMSKLTRFLSPKISNLIMSGEVDDPLKTRRAEITAVYVDLRGFTSFTETADPEEVMSVLREYHGELGRAITAYDATIEHYAGDGVMILLNAPLSTEDHELHAIDMCLQIRDSIGALIEGWRKRGFDLGCGVGIAGGYATLGMIGFEGRMDYSAVGTVCNLAARLCNEAAHGQILLPSRVLLKVEEMVDAEPIGELTLKGIQRPVEVYNLVGLRSESVRQAAGKRNLKIVS